MNSLFKSQIRLNRPQQQRPDHGQKYNHTNQNLETEIAGDETAHRRQHGAGDIYNRKINSPLRRFFMFVYMASENRHISRKSNGSEQAKQKLNRIKLKRSPND